MPPWSSPGSSRPSEHDCPSAHWVFGYTGHRSLGPSFIYSATPIETTFFFSPIGAGGWDTQIIIVFAPWWGRLLSLETQLVSQNE